MLTADHGTNVSGDRKGRPFHKTSPPGMNEARVPLVVHVPGGGSGQSDAITQPQDIFATILAIAGGQAPETIESHDLLEPARQPSLERRRVALCGTSVSHWKRWGANKVLFSALDKDWCLGFAASPQQCQLQRLGSPTDVAAGNPDVVARLRTEAIQELTRRGVDPALTRWLESEGTTAFPQEFQPTDAHPAPPTWKSYFGRLYHGV